MRNKENIKEQIIFFFQEEFGIDIDESTQFFIDTGIDGDDGQRFVKIFQKKFEIDMSSFDFNTYFLSEEAILKPNIIIFILLPFIFLFKLFFGSAKKRFDKYFTLAHLVKVVEQGKWFDPE
jgi:hypothetical protein